MSDNPHSGADATPVTRGVAIVITARYHNPSILNHDFLMRNAIIDDSWGAASDITSMPPYSTISYKSRAVQISCQEGRLQFNKELVDDMVDFSDIVTCAAEYVRVLEHVPYTGFGLNCSLILRVPDGKTWVKRRFLRDEFIGSSLEPATIRIALRYPLSEGGVLTAEFRSQEASAQQDIRILSNYHCQITNGYADLLSRIRQSASVKAKNDDVIRQIVGER